MGAVVHLGTCAQFLEKECQEWNVPETRTTAHTGAGSGPRLVGGGGRWVGGQPVAQGVPLGTGHLAFRASGCPAAPYPAPTAGRGPAPHRTASRLPLGPLEGPGPGGSRGVRAALCSGCCLPSGAQLLLAGLRCPASLSHLGGCEPQLPAPGAHEGREAGQTTPLPAAARPGEALLPRQPSAHRWFRARGGLGARPCSLRV